MSEDSDTRFDGIFMNVLQQKQKIEGFFEAVFGFLRRQSDFFGDNKKAEDVIVTECKKQFLRYAADKKQKEEDEKTRLQKEAAKKNVKQQAEQKQQQQQPAKPVEVVQVQKQEKQADEKIETEGEEKEKKDDEKAPLGNGGRTDNYIWTQTLEEVQLYIPVPEGLKSKDLVVKLTTERLLIEVKGKPAIVDGEFFEKIHCDGSIWTITEGEIQDYKGRYVHVSIEKWKNQMHWWDCVIKGDAKINTQKVNPEPSRLDELEGETRGTVEKMMFDMRQKQMGLPSSDELDKKGKLNDFMKAHPEMDFSKCKFN